MWVFLNNAFLSIVEDKDDSTRLMVRARLRGDIERAMLCFPKVTETPAADYRFRASIDRDDVVRAMESAVRGIDYTNFKKSVPDQRRHDAYLRVWTEMLEEQNRALRKEDFSQGKMPLPEAWRTLFEGPVAGGKVSARAFKVGAPTTEFVVPGPVILPPTKVKKRVSPRGTKGSRPRSRRR